MPVFVLILGIFTIAIFFGIMLNLARRPSIYIFRVFFQKCFVLLIHLNFKSHFDKVSSQSLKVFDLALTLNV